jgi:hypothetical protein
MLYLSLLILGLGFRFVLFRRPASIHPSIRLVSPRRPKVAQAMSGQNTRVAWEAKGCHGNFRRGS